MQRQLGPLSAEVDVDGAEGVHQVGGRNGNAEVGEIVLDPACGSGNFLYLALKALKDLEREAILWGSLTLGTAMQLPQVGPEAVRGIELNSYAAELARVVIWIGEIQWMLSNGFDLAGLATYWQNVVVGALIIGAIALQSAVRRQ